MKIGNPSELLRIGGHQAHGALAETDTKSKASSSASSTSLASAGSATVQLSDGLASLTGDLGSEDSFDAKRVEEMKAAIANGSFKVNADVVADKLISGNLEALSRSKSC